MHHSQTYTQHIVQTTDDDRLICQNHSRHVRYADSCIENTYTKCANFRYILGMIWYRQRSKKGERKFVYNCKADHLCIACIKVFVLCDLNKWSQLNTIALFITYYRCETVKRFRFKMLARGLPFHSHDDTKCSNNYFRSAYCIVTINDFTVN